MFHTEVHDVVLKTCEELVTNSVLRKFMRCSFIFPPIRYRRRICVTCPTAVEKISRLMPERNNVLHEASNNKSAHLFTDHLSTIHLLTSHWLLDCCERSNTFLTIRPDNDCNAETPWLRLVTAQVSSFSASLTWERLLTLILTVRKK